MTLSIDLSNKLLRNPFATDTNIFHENKPSMHYRILACYSFTQILLSYSFHATCHLSSLLPGFYLLCFIFSP